MFMLLMRISIMLFANLLLAGCGSINLSAYTQEKDPFESFNRGVYKFNDTLDRAVVKPVAQGYNKVVPSPIKTMVSNFFSNLDDVVVTANDILQLKFRQAASDGARVVFNTTFGIFGLINITDRLEKHNEDFGQTLGYWGVPSGPYLVLPILGPSTIRDGTGVYTDSYFSVISNTKDVPTRNSAWALEGLDTRVGLLEQEKVLDDAVIDRYSFIRDAYLQHRQSLVYDGNPPRQKFDDDD
ncbi:putative phospholipid-binding lipoprotein MlaA precursor [mine drainage metagenome]|uniref:Putative phospholipid-binding lipoprotein MlaA n=1 Tax=mine drainage metagenome TaxID=410659 RepID=A0A1J5SDM7_9ZZZZ